MRRRSIGDERASWMPNQDEGKQGMSWLSSEGVPKIRAAVVDTTAIVFVIGVMILAQLPVQHPT